MALTLEEQTKHTIEPRAGGITVVDMEPFNLALDEHSKVFAMVLEARLGNLAAYALVNICMLTFICMMVIFFLVIPAIPTVARGFTPQSPGP
jgi:hypothetical protein